MWKTDFDPMEIEIITSHSNLMVIRTCDLLPTLLFMQNAWRRLRELIPDDQWDIEFNILTYYKCKNT